MKKYKKSYNSGKNNSNYIDGRSIGKHYCINCEKEISDYRHKRCISCANKIINRTGKNNPNYKDGGKKYYCMDCGIKISYCSKRCKSCSNKYKTKSRNKDKNNPFYGLHHSKKVKEKVGKSLRESWQNGAFNNRKIIIESPSQPEKEIMKILKKLGIDYIFQYRPNGYSKIYDFYIPKDNKLIEYNSKYWHNLSGIEERDREKVKYARENNYELLIIDEENINNFKKTFKG